MHGKDAGQGLGEFSVVSRDEVSPGRGHALEAADRSGWEAAEDLDDKVIGEAGRRGPPSLGPPLLYHRLEQELMRKMKSRGCRPGMHKSNRRRKRSATIDDDVDLRTMRGSD